jgi:hypothetical protein
MDDYAFELQKTDTTSILVSEIFGSLLAIANVEWAKRYNSSINPLESHVGYLNRDEPPEKSKFEQIDIPLTQLRDDFFAFVRSMDINERACVEQW